MSSGNNSTYIRKLYDHAVSRGIPEECLFGKENLNSYIETSINAYSDYALLRHVFKGNYDPVIFTRMMTVDLKSRLGSVAGISGSNGYESVMLLEPPCSKKTGMTDYFGVASPEDFTLLLRPIMYRLENFEKFALEKRKPYLDDKTWYLYIFATKEEFKGSGYGKQLMNILLSYAEGSGCRICLETNDPDNVGMYEHFGFKTVEESLYQHTLSHYNMLYEPSL